MQEVPNYEKLKIWQEGVALAINVYELTKKFPKDELFGITGQLRRAAVSVSLNIAEGQGRRTDGDFRRFLFIAKGSLQELMTLIKIAEELKFCNKIESLQIRDTGTLLLKMIQSLINSLEK